MHTERDAALAPLRVRYQRADREPVERQRMPDHLLGVGEHRRSFGGTKEVTSISL